MATSVFLTALVAVGAPLAAQADLPVHCLRHQVVGDWEFKLGPLGPKRTSCGHQRPDNPDRQPSIAFLNGEAQTRHFSLQDMNVASAEDGSTGTWTMIYDEAFEVAMGNMVYLAFSKFEFVTDANGRRTNQSHCGETQVGWYHNADRSQWGCYVGKKTELAATSGDDAETSQQAAPAKQTSQLSWASTVSSMLLPSTNTWTDQSDQQQEPQQAQQQGSQHDEEDDSQQVQPQQGMLQLQQPPQQAQPQQQIALPQSAAQLEEYLDKDSPLADFPKKSSPPEQQSLVEASPGYDRPMPSEWQESVAEALNFLQLGWVAVRYDMFEGKTPRQLNKLAGVKRGRHNQFAKKAKRLPKDFSSFLGIGSRVRRTGALNAENFDWRNSNGNWLEPVVNQGDCGSCYTIATVHMLTARNRIRKRDMSEPSFSVSFPLYCSEYNQGCDGGYGFLQSKWLEDVGLLPENCLPFTQGGGRCEVKQGCDLAGKRYHATGHHYVGGYYGASDAEQTREELVRNGPVVMSFEPKEDFMYYKSGVYKSGPNKIHQEWERVDHAVLLMGYGQEKQGSYWTLQNSWGDDWGEAGFFRMARGIDESGCESIVVAAEVEEDLNTDVLDEFVNQINP